MQNLKAIHPAILSAVSGLLLFAAWPVSPFTFLIFIAFVPLLIMEDRGMSRLLFFVYTNLALLIWNIGTTWWTCNSTVPGGIAAMLANSLLMSIPWIGFYNVKKRMGSKAGYISFIIFWLCFEYIHLNWELSWPWLTIGNVFATHPGWVQWYEYTGVGGGSLWVMLVNLLVFFALKKNRRASIALGIVLVLPFVVTIIMGSSGEAGQGKSNIVVVQPNVDPWDEKFAAGKQEAQLQKLIQLSESKIDPDTRLVVWPETAIPVAINEDSLKNSYFILPVWGFLKAHPSINLVTGIEGFRFYKENNKSATARRIPESAAYFDSYNSAVIMDSNDFKIYHKSKLVPGAEIMPSFLHFLDSWFEKFGGTTGGYVGQKERTVLKSFNNSYRIAPAVCYESIYGEFMSKYICNGANIITVITNDGWWGNTAGYRQHENYARLRAIETRRWVVRSANTGISCFIDPWGKVIDPQPWDKTAAIKLTVPTDGQEQFTFYTRVGDLIFKIAVVLTLLMIGWNLFVMIKNRLNRG